MAEAHGERVHEEQGGEAACWLTQVCPECGHLTEDRRARACARCGADLPEPS